MENQPKSRRDSQIDRKPPTDKVEIGIPDASKHAVLYNVVSNSFWALLDWVISIWRFGFGKQKPKDDQRPSTTISDNQAVSGNTRDEIGSFPVGKTPQKHARKKVKANSSNSSTNAKLSPPFQTQITKDDKPKDDQKPSTTVSGNQAVSGTTRDHNGGSSVGNTRQKHGRKKDKANSSNSSTNAKSSPPSQTQITKDDKPKDDQKPSTTVSGNQAVSGTTRDHNGGSSVGNTRQKHGRKKDKANSSNSSTNAKSSPPSQTQITKDDKPKDDQKPSTTVSDNQVSRNTGDDNGRFSVGNKTQKHARKKHKANSSNSSTSAKSSPSPTQISEDDKPEDDWKPCIVVSRNQVNDNKGHRNGSFSIGNT